MKKLIAMLLVLTVLCSVLPCTASAWTIDEIIDAFNKIAPPPGDSNEDDGGDDKIGGSVEGTATREPKKEKKKEEKEPVYYHPGNEHEFGYASNAKYHWLQCPCGCQISMEPHVDPKDTSDDNCFCGYHFSSNADLVTLWVDGCPPIKNFNKNNTEYKLNAYTYKDVKEIKIATRTYDSEATVELPEDLTLKAGENKFDVKVIAENQKVTKTYTLIITK